MASFNRWTGMGRLTKDPELKFLPSGMAAAQIRIACNEKYKTATGELKEMAYFKTVKVYGKTAEAVGEYLKKGAQVLVEGPLRLEEWTGQDGQKRSADCCVADRVVFLDSRNRAEGTPAAGDDKAPASGTQGQDVPTNSGPKADDDDLPF